MPVKQNVMVVGSIPTRSNEIFYILIFSLYFGRGNLVLRHSIPTSVPYLPLNSRGLVYLFGYNYTRHK